MRIITPYPVSHYFVFVPLGVGGRVVSNIHRVSNLFKVRFHLKYLHVCLGPISAVFFIFLMVVNNLRSWQLFLETFGHFLRGSNPRPR